MSTDEQATAPTKVLDEQFLRACPDYRFAETEPPYASFDRRKAIVPWRFTGTMTGPLDPPGFAPTSARIQIEGDDHWEFRGDLVYRCRVLYDANDVAMQLGASPAPGSRGERLGVLLQRLQAWSMRRRAAR